MKLKKIPLKTFNSSKVFLAPMEEVNDIAFRILCKKAGAGLTYTSLTSPLSPQQINLQDKPILQIFANETRGIREFIKKYDKQVSGWDLNLGCPAKTAKKHKYGAYMDNLELVEKILILMRKNTKKPISIKIRKSKNAQNYLELAQKYCDAISIHPRTKEQGYSGEPDIEWAKKFKKKSKIPVIYSGNVNEKNYKNFLKFFDYVMVGRSAIGRPELFNKIALSTQYSVLNTKYSVLNTNFSPFKEYLILAKKYKIPWRNIKFQAMQFTKGEKNSRKKRAKIIYAKNVNELKEIFFNK